MLVTSPGDVVAMPRSRRSLMRSADADFIATAKSGDLAATRDPEPETCFEDSHAGRWIFGALIVASLATAAHQFGWL